MQGKRAEPEDEQYRKSAELRDYRICDKTLEILDKLGIKKLFPIQLETFDYIYDEKDIIGRDLTGSGKTLAYALPLVERFREQKLIGSDRNSSERKPILLVMLPTRELAIQVSNVFEQLKHSSEEYKVLSVYGGASIEPQIDALTRGIDIIVGTTGRLLDHLSRGTLPASGLRCVILDEADRMLDMGFQEDVERIYSYIHKALSSSQGKSRKLQGMLFSATLPSWVQGVASKYLDQNYTLVDLVKNLSNKTVSSVRHLAVYCLDYNRSTTLADISNS